MRFAVVLVLVAACGDPPANPANPGMGACGNSDPSQGPLWSFESTTTFPHSSTIEFEMQGLVAGDTGLVVVGLQYANAIETYAPPITAMIMPGGSTNDDLYGTFGKIPSVTEPTCKWDSIGPD